MKIDLSWQHDDFDRTAQFRIERSKDDDQNFSIIADSVARDVSSFCDSAAVQGLPKTLLQNTKYFYRVIAVNPTGDSENNPEESAATSGPRISIKPVDSIVTYDKLVLNTSQDSTFMITNTKPFPLVVTSINLVENSGPFTPKNFPNTPFTIGNSQTENFAITFTPMAAGGAIAKLLIVSNDASNDSVFVELTGRGNTRPVANAGVGQNVVDADGNNTVSVVLNGSGSFDPDTGFGDFVKTYSWRENSVEIATGVMPTVGLSVGNHMIMLIVTDECDAASDPPGNVLIRVDPNNPPMAVAGDDQTLCDVDGDGVEDVMLDGSGSFDPDSSFGGSITTYSWLENGVEIASGVRPAKIPLTVDDHTITLKVTDNGGAMATDEVLIKVNPNTPPMANAGPDQTSGLIAVNGVSADVTLDGSGSFDPDSSKGDSIKTYSWLENNIEIATGINPTVPLAVGDHTIILKVTDNGGSMGTDDVFIRVTPNTPPMANAGDDQVLCDFGGNGGQSAMLDGSQSFDPDSGIGGSITTYSWLENGLEIATGPKPTVTLPVGDHTITLKVTDNGDAMGTDDVFIKVTPNTPPMANAGPDQVDIIAVNGDSACVTLNGSGSFDPDSGKGGSIDIYSWLENNIEIATGPNPIVCLTVGDHTITLKVTDNGSEMATDDVLIRVKPNTPPIADAGPNQMNIADSGGDGVEDVMLDGSGSFDPDSAIGGEITNYSWREGNTEIATGEKPIVNLTMGNHIITLTVTDNGDSMATDTVIIMVNNNTPPKANAGRDTTVIDVNSDGSESVILDGSGSSDFNGGSIVTYSWRTANGDLIASVEAPMVDLSVAGSPHTIFLMVTDNGGATDTDSVTITVEENTSPVANAGGDTTLVDVNGDGSVLVTLDGSASFDSSGGTIENYSWLENGAEIATGVNPNVSLSIAGSPHTILLVVTDNGGATDTNTVTIQINPNTPPMPVIPQTLEIPDLGGDGMESVILDGSMSFDPDSGVTEAGLKGAIAAYLWEDITTAGSPVMLGSDAVITTVLDTVVHTIRLTVTDNGGAAASAVMTVTVKEIQLNIVPSKWYFGTLQSGLADLVPSVNDFTVSNISQNFTLTLEAKLMQGNSSEFKLINDDITLAPGADWTPRVMFSPSPSGELRRIEDVLQIVEKNTGTILQSADLLGDVIPDTFLVPTISPTTHTFTPGSSREIIVARDRVSRIFDVFASGDLIEIVPDSNFTITAGGDSISLSKGNLTDTHTLMVEFNPMTVMPGDTTEALLEIKFRRSTSTMPRDVLTPQPLRVLLIGVNTVP